MNKYLDIPLADWTIGLMLEMVWYMIVAAAPWVGLLIIILVIGGCLQGLINLIELIAKWLRTRRERDRL